LKRVEKENEKADRMKPLLPLSEDQIPFAAPPGWAWAKMSELAHIVSGVTKGRNLTNQNTISVPYLRVANVQRGYLDLSEIKYIDIKADELDKYLLQDGDLLLTEGGDADKVGRSAIWRNEISGCIHQNHIFRARPVLQELSVDWLTLCTNSQYGRDYFLESSKQTTNLASINSTQLKNFPVPLPPLAEQKRIVAKVDELLARCAALERKLGQAQGAGRQLTAAVLQGMVG